MEVFMRLARTNVLCWVVWTSSWNIHICLHECDQQVGIQGLFLLENLSNHPHKPITFKMRFNTFELLCMNMYECICCLFHIFPTHLFLDIRIKSFHVASSLHDFEVSITLVRPKYQPQPRPFKLVILFADGLLYSRSSSRVRQTAIMHFNGNGNLGRGKLWDLKVCPCYGNLCHYSYITFRSLCGHTWKLPSFTMCFNTYCQRTSFLDLHYVGQIKVHEYKWVH